METLILVAVIAILGAVAIRFIIWTLKSIYEYAPFILIVFILTVLLWQDGAFMSNEELREQHYANYSESVKH